MKTPEQWISNYRFPQWSRDWIIAIQSDAREGMVPAAELRPTIELLHSLRKHYRSSIQAVSDHRIDMEITRLESLLGEKEAK